MNATQRRRLQASQPPPGKQCAGVQYATGSAPCYEPPPWAIYDTHHGGKPDRYSCHRHLHSHIDPERGALVVPAEHH